MGHRHASRQPARPKVRIFSILLLAVGLLALAGAAQAQESTPAPRAVTDDDVNQIAKQLYCPVCENVPLDVCPTQACKQWRDTIRQKLIEGWDAGRIKDYFVAQYGERVLAEPSTRGLNLLVWVIPPLVVAAGAVVLWRVLRGMAAGRTAPAAPPPQPAAAEQDEYTARLEAELRRRR